MTSARPQSISTRAEDRALLRSNPSADPGVGVEAGPEHAPVRSLHITFNFNTNAINLKRNTTLIAPQNVPQHSLTPTGSDSSSR